MLKYLFLIALVTFGTAAPAEAHQGRAGHHRHKPNVSIRIGRPGVFCPMVVGHRCSWINVRIPVGTVVDRLPRGARVERRGGRRIYIHNGTRYKRHGRNYIVVRG